jgi:DNA modification methylase
MCTKVMKQDEQQKRGPLGLPIFGIEEIEEREKILRAATLVEVEKFEFNGTPSDTPMSESFDHNMLICGDNLEVMKRLYEQYGSFIDLIYIDPPFCSNRDYEYRAQEKSGYCDKWRDGLTTFVPWLIERIIWMQKLLKEEGTFFVNLDHHAAHYVKVELDKVFGGNNFRNEVVWHFASMSRTNTDFPRKHQNIFRYVKSSKFTFNCDDLRVPYAESTVSRGQYGGAGFDASGCDGGYLNESGKIPDTVWDIPHIKGKEHTKYDNQKPEKLIERIVRACSNSDNVIADFFVGSGTTPSVAQKLGRRWIGVDQNPQAIEVAADRIRQISKQKDKPIGIAIPDFPKATSRGFRKYFAT